MKLIGVTGPSGAGKSSFSIYLNSIMQESIYIPIDLFMRKALQVHSSEILSRYKDISLNDKGQIPLRCLMKADGRMDVVLDLIKPNVSELINREISKLNTEQIIILDWDHLPSLEIWSQLDMRIFISADQTIRIRNLLIRDADDYSLIEKKRIQNKVSLMQFRYSSENCIIFCNNGTLEDLQTFAKNIYLEVQNGKN